MKLLKNKMVLNIVFVITVLNILGYLTMGNFEAVILFILVAGLTSFFSKNMIIVLGIPLIVANLYGMRVVRSFEGLENKKLSEQKLSENKEDPRKADAFEVGRKKGSSKIDYATTVEDAYADLNKILGGDGIKKLTADTQGLLEQQAQLTAAMGNLGPMMKNMKPMMESMGSLMENFKQ